MYEVTEWLGDFPVGNQTFWHDRFRTFKAANFVAKNLYDAVAWIHNSPDYYILVEKMNSSKDDTPLVIYTNKGALILEEMITFLKKYEDDQLSY